MSSLLFRDNYVLFAPAMSSQLPDLGSSFSQQSGSIYGVSDDESQSTISPQRPSSKRPRTVSLFDEPRLPPMLRAVPSLPPIPPTTSFMFRGKAPLYSRHQVDDKPSKMEIRCTQPGCQHPYKVVNRAIAGTNNYKRHYQTFHPQIPLSENEAVKLRISSSQGILSRMTSAPAPLRTLVQTHEHQLRIFLVEWVIKNDLSFSIVDQPETIALFKLLSPNTQLFSRRTLMRHLQSMYEEAAARVKGMLQHHIQNGGRIALTTDAWTGNNKLDYIAVTAHFTRENGDLHSTLLDIIELTEPSHTGEYLCAKLVEVTDRMGVTQSIISITRDNASTNDKMLAAFEKIVRDRWSTMSYEDQAKYFCRFTRAEGDVRCSAHIFNIAVQAALAAIKAEPKEHMHEYQHETNRAPAGLGSERSAFYKIRSLAIIFKLRKIPRAQLKNMCLTVSPAVKYVDLKCDMPTRWNSTDKMLSAALRLEKPIRAVLVQQNWDVSVRRNLTPTSLDWACLREMAIFFNIFRLPTIQSQASEYHTLHNAIPNYIHVMRMLNLWQNHEDTPTLTAAAKASYTIMDKYYKESLTTRHSLVAMLCDPRYKLQLLVFLYEAEGGAQAPICQRARLHFERVYQDYKKRADLHEVLAQDRHEDRGSVDLDQPPCSSPPGEENEGYEDWRVDPLHGWEEHVASQPDHAPHGRSEIQRWLDEPTMPNKSTTEEIRAYMKSKAYDFPLIIQIARDFLAIPASSAPSERVFSIAGNLLSKKRTRISSENVRFVLCLRDWGVLAKADDEEEMKIDEEGKIIGAE